jgi:hypothetical protein
MIGGCSPDPNPASNPSITADLELSDEIAPDAEPRLVVAESSFRCEGNTSSIACKPLESVSGGMPESGGPEHKNIEAFELVGMLRVVDQQGDVIPTLEDIDLDASRRLADGKWEAIPTGVFRYVFP